MGWADASFAGSTTDVSGQIRPRRTTDHIQGRSRWSLTLRPSLSGGRLFAVLPGRVAVDGVDMQHVVHLVRQLDVHRWAGYAVVDNRPVRSRSAPGEVGLIEAVFYLGHPGLSGLVVDDADPLADQVQQHGLLVGVHLGGGEALRFEHPAVLARTQDQVGDLVIQDSPFLLFWIQDVYQLERLVVLYAHGAYRPGAEHAGLLECRQVARLIDRILRWLDTDEARRQHVVLPIHRQVEPEVVAVKLQHPGLGLRRGAEDRRPVEI